MFGFSFQSRPWKTVKVCMKGRKHEGNTDVENNGYVVFKWIIHRTAEK